MSNRHLLNRLTSLVILSCYSSAIMINPWMVAHADVKSAGGYVLVPYEAKVGDTLTGLSQRHDIPVTTLVALNEATLNSTVEVIKAGSVIYVPAQSAHSLPELGGANNNGESNNDKQLEFLSEQAMRLGQTYGTDSQGEQRVLAVNSDTRFSNKLTDDNSTNVIKGEKQYLTQQMKSVFESEANDRINALIGGYGTASAKLNFGDDFSVSSYEADVLAPLMDNDTRMMFVQAGARYNDNTKRSIFNLGVGQRHFFDEWMLGYNTFFDYDLTRSHSRLGLGGEAWADFLKLSANLYSPLSGWKASRDFDEYLERAARGVDLNAKYYLPKYPQVSLSAKLEQYFGDEVDLLGSKTLERNPYAGTLGLEWQPIPLLKMGVDHRQAKGSQSDTQLNLGMEWKLGASLDDMVNTNKLAQSRSLQGMRHDLVERNNNIVLEYKEKQRSVTIEHAPLSGLSGDVIALNPVVSLSRGNIVSWRWSATDPLLQGGVSDATLQSPTLTLPELPPETLLDKEFSLYLTITDERGRSYQSSAIPVIVQVDPKQLLHRLILVQDGNALADSTNKPDGKIAISSYDPKIIELVGIRQRHDNNKAYTSEPLDELVFEQLPGYVIEKLDTELRTIANRAEEHNLEEVWVSRMSITPRVPGGKIPTEILSVFAKHGADETGRLNITLYNEADPIEELPPEVTELHVSGKMQLGQMLSATYRFTPSGQDDRDHSTYMWGEKGTTVARLADATQVVESGQVPGLLLAQNHVGQVIELSLQARDGLAEIGNTLTVDTSMSSSEGNATEGGPTVTDPSAYHVKLALESTATLQDNGVNGVRPVANQDKITALCKAEGENDYMVCDESRYTLRWLRLDQSGIETEINDINSNSYVARSIDQGHQILVETSFKE
ncbi:MAG: inverse autotransporter beta domain-containing protein [Shewanella sp.]